MLLLCVLYCSWGYFTFSICCSRSVDSLAVWDPHSSASNAHRLGSKRINSCVRPKQSPTLQALQSSSYGGGVRGLLSFRAAPAAARGAESLSGCSSGSICLGFALYRQRKRAARRYISHGDVKRCERAAVWNSLSLCTCMRVCLCARAAQCHLDGNLQEAPRAHRICMAQDRGGERE